MLLSIAYISSHIILIVQPCYLVKSKVGTIVMITGHKKQIEKCQNIIDKLQVKQLQFLLSKGMPRSIALKVLKSEKHSFPHKI